MKRTIATLSLAAAFTLAAAQPQVNQDGYLDRTLPTYPEIALDGYRFNAGESTHDLVVQDTGSV